MQSLLDNPGLRRQLGSGANVMRHRFATEQVVEHFEHLYRTVVAA
jgi:hypothetical protein